MFRGVFRVIEGDAYTPVLADPSTDLFRRLSRDLREGLNLVYKRSTFRHSFLGTEILALDGEEGVDLVVHFNLHFDPHKQDILVPDLVNVLSRSNQSPYLGNRTIDLDSVHIYESLPSLNVTSTAPITASTPKPVTTTLPPPRVCTPLQLPYCSSLPYNVTSYPNVVGHKSIQQVQDDVIAFREMVDAECYRLAFQFVCQILQPACSPGGDEHGARITLPCRTFCEEFWAGCGKRLQQRFTDALHCSNFPEFSTIGQTCTSTPGCKESLELRGLEARICDGVPDCADLSDELSCSYCPAGYIHCGVGTTCIPATKRCDGTPDCPNHSDERACLAVAPSISGLPALLTAHPGHTLESGHVIYNDKGSLGKLCLDNINETVTSENKTGVLFNVATSLCRTLNFKKVKELRVETDSETGVKNYVQMDDPTADQINFIQGPCPGKSVLYISCMDLECGLQSSRSVLGISGLAKMAALGDWPWHAALLKDGVHVCDATLVAPQWLLTSASCFQGQQKAEWIARLGSIRLTSTSPWQQERHIVGMVKSPVEGSTMVLVKLDSPATISDFVRPICLPQHAEPPSLSTCNTLGWTRNREMLQRVEVQESDMESCANISITTVNSLCADSQYSIDDCSEEELAGSPMMCLNKDSKKWTLVGITNWRIACSKVGSQRPRLYDKTGPNIDWIHTTIQEAQ